MLAGLISGCQDNVSTTPADNINHHSIVIDQNLRENTTTVNADMIPAENNSIFIAYYFHRAIRCQTCLIIEMNAARVIEDNFPQQIADEKLMWIPYNLDDPGGDELEKEFDISVSTLVLAKMQDSHHTRFKKLEKVWEYVGDPALFDNYVRTEVEQFLNQ